MTEKEMKAHNRARKLADRISFKPRKQRGQEREGETERIGSGNK